MARRRYVSSSISIDARIAQLVEHDGEFAALLYTWMLTAADDSGRVPLHVSELRATVVPTLRRTDQDVERAVAGMVRLRLVLIGADGLYFPRRSWYRHQSYIPAGKRRNLDPGEVDAEQGTLRLVAGGPEPLNAADRRQTPRKAASPSPSPTKSFAAAPVKTTQGRAERPSEILARLASDLPVPSAAGGE